MGYKTYTQQLNDLRKTIIASIKSYLKKNIGGGSLDLKEHPLPCCDLGGGSFCIEKASVFEVQVVYEDTKLNLKFDQLSTDDLRRFHSFLQTGSEHL